ncbi:MAG TPA: hypothetical protein PLK94_13980 [Alphaproteobacteria bacterium]|nr:hypothetical protein [Alphaproteobacteria bacterium]
MKTRLLIASIIMAVIFLQGDVCHAAAKKKPAKPKAIVLKSLEAVPFKDFPAGIKETLNGQVRDFEPDREISIEEYIEIIGDEPVGYNIDLNGDKTMEFVVLLPEPETQMILIIGKSEDKYLLTGEFWGELEKFGPSKTKGYLDVFGQEFNQDTGEQEPWQLSWDGDKYIQKEK